LLLHNTQYEEPFADRASCERWVRESKWWRYEFVCVPEQWLVRP
jgi:hypothetical protein